MKDYSKDPVAWAWDILGIKHLWKMQEEVLNGIVEGNVAVKSGNGMGKDFTSAVAILWFAYNFPGALVLATGPSQRQVQEVIFGEMKRLWYPKQHKLGGKMFAMELRINEPRGWKIIGFTTKETNQMVGKFSGYHAAHQLVVITEAQAISSEIWEQIHGCMCSEHYRMYVCGNPLYSQGNFWKIFNDKNYGAGFKKLTFSCYDAPNVIQGKNVIPGMVTLDWVQEREKAWGLDSPEYQARVLGEFPKTAIFSLIGMDELIGSIGSKKAFKGPRVLGIDSARYGDDESAFVVVEGGNLLKIITESGNSTDKTEDTAKGMVAEDEIEMVVVDEGTFGAAIYDHLQKDIGETTNCSTFNFGSSPYDTKFANIGTEAYFTVCNLIKSGFVSLIDDPELLNQLAYRRYHYSTKFKNRMILESKEEIRNRGLPSPDRADAFVMAIFIAFHNQKDSRSPEQISQEEEESDLDYFSVDKLTGYPQARDLPMFI